MCVVCNDLFSFLNLQHQSRQTTFAMVAFHVIQAVIWGLLIVVSLPMNIVCLIALYRTPSLKSVTRAFLVSLTIADLTVIVLYVTPAFAASISGNNWPFGYIGCLIQGVFVQSTSFRVFFSLLMVNVDRYIAIAYPLHHSRWVTLPRARALIVGIWTMHPICFVVTGVYANWKMAYHQAHQYCVMSVPEGSGMFVLSLALSVAMPNIVLLITLALYARIVNIVSKHRRSIKQSTCLPHGTATTRHGTLRSHRSRKQDSKMALSLLILIFAIVCSLLPIDIILILDEVFSVKVSDALIFVAEVCFCCGTWLDVIIYYLRDRELRLSMNALLHRCMCATNFRRNGLYIDGQS